MTKRRARTEASPEQRRVEADVFLLQAQDIARGLARGEYDHVELSFAERRRTPDAANRSQSTISLHITYSGRTEPSEPAA